MTSSAPGREDAAVIDLRPAVDADAPAVADLWEQGWRDGHVGNVPEGLVAMRTHDSFRTRAAARIADTTVAEVRGELAGFIMLAGDEVEQVYVAAAHRGSGVAAVLLAEAERLVAAAGHDVAWLKVVPGNTRARRFYARHGWIDAGLIDYPAADDGDTVHVPCRRYLKAV